MYLCVYFYTILMQPPAVYHAQLPLSTPEAIKIDNVKPVLAPAPAPPLTKSIPGTKRTIAVVGAHKMSSAMGMQFGLAPCPAVELPTSPPVGKQSGLDTPDVTSEEPTRSVLAKKRIPMAGAHKLPSMTGATPVLRQVDRKEPVHVPSGDDSTSDSEEDISGSLVQLATRKELNSPQPAKSAPAVLVVHDTHTVVLGNKEGSTEGSAEGSKEATVMLSVHDEQLRIMKALKVTDKNIEVG